MENFNITAVQIIKNAEDVLSNICIDDKYLLQLKKNGFYIPASNEDTWGGDKNMDNQNYFKENFSVDEILIKLNIENVRTISDLKDFSQNNFILLEIV